MESYLIYIELKYSSLKYAINTVKIILYNKYAMCRFKASRKSILSLDRP